MSCLPCFNKDDDDDQPETEPPPNQPKPAPPPPDISASKAQAFNFRELAMATRNFRQECLIGEGGFGRVFKGKLQATGQVVAVKQLDRKGMQGNKEFLDEVLLLSLYEHPNLIGLLGYCADGDQRLLVYEFMEMGSLENHLFGDDHEKKQMEWHTRMKIASGVANGLEYMHDTANPTMIYRDLKPSNILLDDSYEPKLSDYGLAKLGTAGDGTTMNPASRVMGTYGYSAPEYSKSGELTLKSDIYSYGVVLLELITGRRAIDTNRPNDEQNLVTWAQPIFREPKRFIELADPRLNREFPVMGLNQAVGICAMCLQEESCVRPLAADVVAALSFLSIPQPNAVLASSLPVEKETKALNPPPEQKMKYDKEVSKKRSDKDGSSEDDDDGSGEESEEDEESDGESGEEGGNNSRGESSHSSEDESEYSDSDDAEESDSKKHGASKRAVSSKKISSKQRKSVVTFKEPHSSSKSNDRGGGNRGHTSSSSSGSESESDGEEAATKDQGDKRKSSRKKSKENRGKSVDMAEGRQDDEGRKLQHQKTR